MAVHEAVSSRFREGRNRIAVVNTRTGEERARLDAATESRSECAPADAARRVGPVLPLFFLADVVAAPAALPLRDKTLVAWVAPANLTQRGGSILTLID